MTEKDVQISAAGYRFFLLGIVLSYFLSSFDGNKLNVSLPEIAEYFHTGTGTVSWIVVVYLLAFSSSMLLLGRLSDLIGIRKLLTSGFFLFGTFSVLCGLSDNLFMLIIFRLIQGFGGAMIVVSSFSAVSRYLPENLTGRGYALLNITSAVAVTIGAPAGGFISEYLSWKWNFYINLPLTIIVYIIALKSFPPDEKKMPGEKIEFDVPGALAGFIIPLFFMLFISFAKELGFKSALLWSFLAVALASLYFFIRRENRIKNPLFDMSVFRIRGLAIALVPVILSVMLQGGQTFLLPFYFDDIKMMDPAGYGILLIVYSIIFISAGYLSPRIFRKLNPGIIGSIGLALMMSACAVMIAGLNREGLIFPVIYLVLMGLGFGIYNAPTTSAIMSRIPRESNGLFSGVFQIIIRTSLTMGIVLFETIYSSGTGTHGETLIDEAAASAEEISALIFSYRAAFTAGLVLSGAALLVLNISGRRNTGRNSS